jgi:hypothetical protein
MNDEDQQAERLRERLDHELITVRATAEARERLDSRIAPSLTDQRIRRPLRRLPVVLALPLAAAGAVVAVVAVPGLLRSNPTIAPAAASTPAPSPTPAQTPRRTAGPAPVDSGVQLEITPAIVQVGQRVIVTVTGTPRLFGDLTVTWADGSSDTLAHRCSAQAPATLDPVGHVYRKGGRYEVRVVLDDCGADGVVPALTRRVSVTTTTARAEPR